jgi:hypothetical protein
VISRRKKEEGRRKKEEGKYSHIKSGGMGINITRSQETAVPFPYNIISGRDTALPSPLYHSVA